MDAKIGEKMVEYHKVKVDVLQQVLDASLVGINNLVVDVVDTIACLHEEQQHDKVDKLVMAKVDSKGIHIQLENSAEEGID